MADETRKLLKVFGVTVTEFEGDAERLAAAAAQLSAASGKDEVLTLVKEMSERCSELNRRWLEVTQHVFAAQERALAVIADAASRAR
jgi:hypothetical protein